MAYVYLNGPTLATSTAVYQDSALSVYAPYGYYSNGTIVRQWVGGMLLPPQLCPSCASPCGGEITASGSQGVYTISVDLGTTTGAVIIEFDPASVPDGILVEYDGVFYNELSSPVYGYLASSIANEPTYIGFVGSDCGLVAGSPHTVNVFNYVSGSFTPTGGTQTVSVASGQLALTAGPPGNCIMVIPKINATPSIMDITCFGLCSSTVFYVNVSCPQELESVAGSIGLGEQDCGATIDQTYYVSVSAGNIGDSGSYEFAYIFTDVNGEFPLAAGFYTILIGSNPFNIEVDSHGIIISITSCS
jgi:hypothetical protein